MNPSSSAVLQCLFRTLKMHAGIQAKRAPSFTIALLLILTACGDGSLEHAAKQEAFVYAARDGDIEKMKLLLKEGVEIDAPAGFEGHRIPPALIVVVGNGRIDVVKFLLDNGADVNVKGTDFNSTPLMSAAWAGRTDVAQLLISKGANVNAVDSEGNNALKFAMVKGHPDVVNLLKQAGAE